MSKQSSVEWLIEQIDFDANTRWFSQPEWFAIFEKSKAMHKEEIEDSYIECWMNDGGNGFHKVKEAEQYYNETFGGQDNE